MTAQEMLIEVNTSLQAIGASRTRKFYTEEIEWYLNKAVNRFVQNCIRHKENTSNGYSSRDVDVTVFEIDELYRDALRNLLEEQYLPTDYAADGLSAKAYLPQNYSYLTDIGAYCTLCTKFNVNALTSAQFQVIGVPIFGDSAAGSSPYFTSVTVTLNGSTIYTRSGGYTYKSAFQFVEELCQNTPLTQNSVGPFIKNGYLMMLVPKPSGTNAVFTIAYDAATLTSTVLNTFTQLNTTAAPSRANVPTRTVRDTNRYNSKTTSYYEVSGEDVPCDIKGYVVNIDTATNFIVNGMLVTYIRKPERISVSLNNTSDIATEYHNQICDMTVQIIRERIGDPKYQTGAQDIKS